MKSKLVIFVIGIIAVAAVFLAGIASSPVAFATGACWVVTDTVNYCTTSSDQKWYVCVLDKKTGNRPCKEMKFSGPPDSPPDNLPPKLQNSLDAAIAETQHNDTKVPKSGLLNEGGILKEQGDNQTTSKAILGDRFCVEGTGGDTGNKCIPCDPGLKLGNCIDVITGGPLDMPDAATSETEEEDDTNPKDLGGLNDDENGPNVNPGSD